jgi:hypothetical protein
VAKKIRIAAYVTCGLLFFLVLAVGGLYIASQHVPQFYEEALNVDEQTQRRASDEMLQRLATLKNDTRKVGTWQSLFSAQQINGWLAVDLVENHPDALPKALEQPRVAIEPNRVLVGCRFHRGKLSSVLSLEVDVYLVEPNVFAVRIYRARAGALPVPLTEVLEEVERAVHRQKWKLEWRKSEGDPVAVIRVPPRQDGSGKAVHLEKLELRDGEIFLGGSTEWKE